MHLGNEYSSSKRYCTNARTGLVFKDTAPISKFQDRNAVTVIMVTEIGDICMHCVPFWEATVYKLNEHVLSVCSWGFVIEYAWISE